jgi:hypothetical protein
MRNPDAFSPRSFEFPRAIHAGIRRTYSHSVKIFAHPCDGGHSEKIFRCVLSESPLADNYGCYTLMFPERAKIFCRLRSPQTQGAPGK